MKGQVADMVSGYPGTATFFALIMSQETYITYYYIT